MLGGALLGGLLLLLRKNPNSPPDLPAAPKIRQPILGGLITFLISLPLIGGIGYAWKTFLDACGYSAGEQEMVDLFRNADDPGLLVFMIILAAVIAPITEELIFRAGIFRYLRTRIPRGLALMLPALLFAILHGNLAALVPLFALGVFFAIAYERTGNIAVPMIAHALFNLNTIVLVMAGVTA
ncbi:MAG: CPBP family intramembrane metalloprotease [Burkholderiales bacterium]|nr:CPBP family intramembrane metalloprotease [Opitutaceae bacterium]